MSVAASAHASAALRRSAEVAARAGAAVAMQGFRAPGLVAHEKTDHHDLVTVYDRGSEEAIREVLLDRHPDSAVLGEEYGLVGDEDARLVWHVDPIDGTAAYATGLAMWCVCIGAELDGRIVAGVVFDPVADQMFAADADGATLNGDQRLDAAGRGTPARATVFSHFPWPRDLVWAPDAAMEQFRRVTEEYGTVRSIGSGALAMCAIAAGWADAVLNLGANSWDVAASAFILRQAGGEYTAYRSGERVDPERDHHCGNYVATVRDARFDTLHELVRFQSGRDAALG